MFAIVDQKKNTLLGEGFHDRIDRIRQVRSYSNRSGDGPDDMVGREQRSKVHESDLDVGLQSISLRGAYGDAGLANASGANNGDQAMARDRIDDLIDITVPPEQLSLSRWGLGERGIRILGGEMRITRQFPLHPTVEAVSAEGHVGDPLPAFIPDPWFTQGLPDQGNVDTDAGFLDDEASPDGGQQFGIAYELTRMPDQLQQQVERTRPQPYRFT